MARDKLSNFLWYEFLVNLFSFFLAHEVGTNHEHVECLRIKQSKTHTHPETEEGCHHCCPSTKPSGWAQLFPRHTTCPRSHELLVSSQTNYLPSSLSTRSLLSSCAFSVTTNIHKSSHALDHGKACSTVSGQPWNQLDVMVKTRWWSLFTFCDSFMFNINTRRYMRDCPKHPNVPPELYNLTDLLIGDLDTKNLETKIQKKWFPVQTSRCKKLSYYCTICIRS